MKKFILLGLLFLGMGVAQAQVSPNVHAWFIVPLGLTQTAISHETQMIPNFEGARVGWVKVGVTDTQAFCMISCSSAILDSLMVNVDLEFVSYDPNEVDPTLKQGEIDAINKAVVPFNVANFNWQGYWIR